MFDRKIWLLSNPDYHKNYQKTYVRKNKKPYNPTLEHARYERDKEKIRARKKAWNQKNKDRCRAYVQNRRAHGRIDIGAWQEKVKEMGSKCLSCGKAEVTMDHIIPLSKGGTNTIGNLQPLCLSCNSRKRDKITVSAR